MKIRATVLLLLAMFAMSAGAENYFRPGTVWTTLYIRDEPPHQGFLLYHTILDEVTFDGEKVLPLAKYDEQNPEPEIERYLRTDGDKVFWRRVQQEEREWHLMYDFGLQPGEETEVYDFYNVGTDVEKMLKVKLKCIERDFFVNDNPLNGPMMKLKVLKYGDSDKTEDILAVGNWIIGSGSAEEFLCPGQFNWSGGGVHTIRVESPKGNVVFEDPELIGYVAIDECEFSEPKPVKGIYNFQGVKLADSIEGVSLPAGLYIINGKKVAVK